jgi:hypothetical protein
MQATKSIQMNAILIGLSSGIVTILIVSIFKRIDKNIIFGLILSGIGLLYVGFTWSNLTVAIISFVQAFFFLLLAYFGIKKVPWFLIAGFFLHGIWDLFFSRVGDSQLLPPHYDLFCLTYDFIIGIYLLLLKYQMRRDPKTT